MLKKLACFCLVAIAILLCNPVVTLADEVSPQDLDAVAIFSDNCSGCHAKGGNIVRRGKNLKLKALKRNHVDNQEAIIDLVTNGKGIMSAYGDRLSSTEIAAVADYVLEQAQQNWLN